MTAAGGQEKAPNEHAGDRRSPTKETLTQFFALAPARIARATYRSHSNPHGERS